jgi:predicted transcriptional regulator/transcriptional regulator with XRE-family HTH domain
MAEMRLGGRLRRLRQERRLTQAQMAEQLGISASYLNLLEHNQRPLTVPILLKLAQRFAIELQQLSTDEDERLLADLMEAFSDPIFDGHDIKAAELKELVGSSPNLGRGLLTLYRAYRGSRASSRPPPDPGAPAGEEAAEQPAGMPSEEVSDFIQQKQNHFPELEAAAESLWRDHGLALDGLQAGLVDLLAKRFAVDVAVLPDAAMGGALRSYNPISRRLALSEMLPPGSRAFQLAHQIALLGWRGTIDRLTSGSKFTTVEADALARVSLANYFAGAVLMPYEVMLEAARATRYDVAVLQHRFGVSFEQLCHRLTTLRRPGAEGVPFHLLRVDVAGNISKRFSASGIRIARFGAACPRWNVYDAFASPGTIRVQLSRMPDGATFFCLARTLDPVARPGARGALGPRAVRLAIGLGCPASQAREIVYADGLALDDPRAVTPIGVSCRVCERTDCDDRALPSLHHRLAVDENRRGLSLYARPLVS